MRAMAKLKGVGYRRRRKVKGETKTWGSYPGESCAEKASSHRGGRTATLQARLLALPVGEGALDLCRSCVECAAPAWAAGAPGLCGRRKAEIGEGRGDGRSRHPAGDQVAVGS